MTARPHLGSVAAAGLAVLLAILVLACPAGARAATVPLGIGAFSSTLSEDTAGGHPDVTTSVTLANDALGNPTQQLKDIDVELPTGLVGNPQAAATCSTRQLRTAQCPPESQIGVIEPFFIIGCRGVGTTLGDEGLAVAPPTEVAEATSGSSEILVLASTAGIESGDILTVGQPGETTEVTVSAVIDGTHLHLTYPLWTTLAAGEPVADNVIHVADTAHFCAGSENEITVGTGPEAETAHISFVLSKTRLALETPLRNQHSLGEPVVHLAEAQTAGLPLFNLEPEPGHLASLGASFLLGSIVIQVDARDDDSGINASMSNLSTLFGMDGARFTLWGVPAAASHDSQRCRFLGGECVASSADPRAFISAPGQCNEPLTTRLHVDSWQEPEHAVPASSTQPPLVGCDRLSFAPTISLTPDTTRPDSPAGLALELLSPQGPKPLSPEPPPIASLALTLPPGVSVSPAGAAGLVACDHSHFEAANCPSASSVGMVSILSPALADPLPGHIYVAEQTDEVPYGLYLIAGNEAITIKLSGHLDLDSATGQVTIVLDGLPQLPLERLRVAFPGGQAALLDTPAVCGPATTTSRLIASSGQIASPESSFVVGGEGCVSPLPFAPGFTAGMTDRRAGAAGDFVLGVSRRDGEGLLSRVGVDLPEGLLGDFSQVGTCSDSAASRGDCPAAAAIGRTEVLAGAGERPLVLPGTVYLTGSYRGAPYGVAIVVPAVSGPYDLGTIIVRGRVTVDPRTLRVSILTDPLPRLVRGVPARIRGMRLDLDRPGFLFNPTDCTPGSIDATIDSAEGVTASPTSLFSVTGCGGLGFTPRLNATIAPHASRAGAGLRLTLRAGAGSQANLESLSVRLPRQLHPRLKAIRKACPAAVYDAAPGGCPAASALSTVTVTSPLLGTGLTATAYLVAPGGSASPVVISSVRAGGATMRLEGTVQLNSRGVATLVFSHIPDVPLQSFQITLPRTKNSVLGATGSLCSGPAPNVGFRAVGQNGARLTRTVSVSSGGCGKRGADARASGPTRPRRSR